MNGTQSWYLSTTIQRSLVGLLVALLAFLKAIGVNIDFDEGQVTETVGALFLIIAFVGSIIGRVKAKKVIE